MTQAFTPVLASVIADSSISAGVFRSYCRLLSMGWRWSFAHTDALDWEEEIVPLLGVSRTQAREHFRLLRAAKLITWASNGAGKYMVSFPIGVAPSVGDGGGRFSWADRLGGVAESGKPDSLATPEFRTLEEEGDSINLINSVASSSSEPESGKPDSAVILANTRELFGERVFGVASKYPDGAVLLAMVAQVYAEERNRVNHPARLVYTRLRDGQEPDQCYVDEPGRYLPAWFCEAVGIEKPVEEVEEVGPAAAALAAPAPVADGLPELPSEAQKAFEIVRLQLMYQVPVALRGLVESTRLVGVDDRRLVIAFPTEGRYTFEFAQDRFALSCDRLLAGLGGYQVQFVGG